MHVSDDEKKRHTALKGAQDGSGNSLGYSCKGLSSHLKLFKNGKDSQFGFATSDVGTFATSQRDVRLRRGKNTLPFGKLMLPNQGLEKIEFS